MNESGTLRLSDGRVVTLRCAAPAEYVQDAGGDAEFAVVVADDWRRIGFGTILVRRLIRDAARAGLNSLRALVLHDNPAMLGLAAQLGFARRRDRDPDMVSLTLRI